MGENQVVGSKNQRTYLVLIKINDVFILDITCPFENGLIVSDDARLEKSTKYAKLAIVLSTSSDNTKIEAIVVDFLGSWEVKNDKILKRLCSEKHSKLLRKIITSEIISHSRNFYFEFTCRLPLRSRGR